MKLSTSSTQRTHLLLAIICIVAMMSSALGQERQSISEQSDDVVRIKTELVQTDVVVLDKKGQFVDGLRPGDFDLSVDGNAQTVSFFERVTSGSAREASQLDAARGKTTSQPIRVDATPPTTNSRGRLIFFFLDDIHLGNASLAKAREALTRFVNERMNPEDQVAIVSSSGQIGFLQQLTDNRTVLHAAIKRLNYKQNLEAYTGKTQISEYMASQIMDNGNRELYAYLLESIKIEQQMGPGLRQGDHRLAASYSAAPYLKNRLRQINGQGRIDTTNTLDALRALMLSSASLPGRKLVFFMSDGFILNERKSGAIEMLERITQAAAGAGAVVYTMDLRGTYFGLGSGVDASTNEYADPSARRVGIIQGEMNASRESLQLIADGTGGRAIFNSNSIDDGIAQAIRETSDYYLLAWRPENDEQRNKRSRVKVVVRNRPELTVRLRSNFYDPKALPIANEKKSKTNETKETQPKSATSQTLKRETELLTTLGSLYSRKDLPLAISVGFVNTPASNMGLKVSMQIERAAFGSEVEGSAQKSELDVIGAAIDDRGVISTFKQVLTVPQNPPAEAGNEPVVWHQQLSVPPGLYQVRVAVRDRQTGRNGSAMQWIEIPDTSKGDFVLSSLFLGERNSEQAIEKKENGAHTVMVDVDRKFGRASVLRFQTYVYNAMRGANGPDVWIQAQVLRNNNRVLSTSLAMVPVTNDPLRLPYWTEIPLNQLPAGNYVLQVSATDRLKHSSTSQQVSFSIE